jgi:eukaryotic-like serine/threonine-protein kinase
VSPTILGQPLRAGTRIGVYEILAPLGAGGFAEVFKARDTRLDRVVAIKVLPSDEPELKARFTREARAIAALPHPHICTVHDVGSDSGIDFLVMEYLHGETLASRLSSGPLPAPEALALASQLADAIAKAHQLGIVHRDLKPANILLTSDEKTFVPFVPS